MQFDSRVAHELTSTVPRRANMTVVRSIKDPELTAFERALLDALLGGPLEVLAKLRAQIACARVVSRQLSGVGFFLDFEVPAKATFVDPPNFEISDVYFDLKGTEHGGAAILFVRAGAVTMLEAYSHAGDWPDEPEEFSIHCFDGAKRDTAKVAAEIASRAAFARRPKEK